MHEPGLRGAPLHPQMNIQRALANIARERMKEHQPNNDGNRPVKALTGGCGGVPSDSTIWPSNFLGKLQALGESGYSKYIYQTECAKFIHTIIYIHFIGEM